jgi:Mitochondrial ribosomal protein L31
MPPRDKYTVFNAKSVGYRKGIHKVPKWTRVSLQLLRWCVGRTDLNTTCQITQRVNPRGF